MQQLQVPFRKVPFRKVPFHFVSFRFAKYHKPFCDISRPLRDVNFTINLAQVRKFIGTIYHIIQGYSKKKLTLSINQHYPTNGEKVLISLQNRLFGS